MLHILKWWCRDLIVLGDRQPRRLLVLRVGEAVAEPCAARQSCGADLVHEATGPVRVRAVVFVDVGNEIAELLLPANRVVAFGRQSGAGRCLGRKVVVAHERGHLRGGPERCHVVRPNEGVGALHRSVVRVLLLVADAAILVEVKVSHNDDHLVFDIRPHALQPCAIRIGLSDAQIRFDHRSQRTIDRPTSRAEPHRHTRARNIVAHKAGIRHIFSKRREHALEKNGVAIDVRAVEWATAVALAAHDNAILAPPHGSAPPARQPSRRRIEHCGWDGAAENGLGVQLGGAVQRRRLLDVVSRRILGVRVERGIAVPEHRRQNSLVPSTDTGVSHPVRKVP
mmetsp:Transcript_9273/g.23836  ORF Transcript_9273/g.23836 Transcript_9273/m.23836 type:complete len:339 (-) Transcript_9273:930-1946(-)